MGQGARLRWVVWWLVPPLLVAAPAQAEEAPRSAADAASVRILVMGSVGIDRVQVDGVKLSLAAPASARRSGFAVTKDGLIVTTAEELAEARAVVVYVPGVSGALPASVLGVHEASRVAFLGVGHGFQSALALAERGAPLAVPQRVFAVGYPLGLQSSEAQASRGSVASVLESGSVELNLSLSSGFSGGPVLDERDRVVGVLRVPVGGRQKTLVGITEAMTPTRAIPLSAFRDQLEALRAGPPRAPPNQVEQNMATLFSLVVGEADAVLSGGIQMQSEAALEAERWVLKFLGEQPVPADGALLTAAFFWNRHISLRLQNFDHRPAFNNALKLVRFAATLDGSIQERSPFAKHVLGQQPDPPAEPSRKAPSLDSGDPDSPEIRFEPAQLDLSLHVRRGADPRDRFYKQVCTGPCSRQVDPGHYQLAVSKGDLKPVDINEPVEITGATVVAASYQSRRVVRIIGWSILGAGTLTGLFYVLGSHQSCSENEGVACEYPNLQRGSILIAGSIVAGLIMGLKSDSIEIEVYPALEPRTVSGRERLPGVNALTHGATLRARF